MNVLLQKSAHDSLARQVGELVTELLAFNSKLQTADIPIVEGANQLTHAALQQIISARRSREHFFSATLFADPAWDIILNLMAARLAGERLTVSGVCSIASVPPTTALRWIKALERAEIVARRQDEMDGRRVFVVLSDSAANAINDWYAKYNI